LKLFHPSDVGRNPLVSVQLLPKYIEPVEGALIEEEGESAHQGNKEKDA